MPDRHIFLIGMQGCGKSSLGKRVARETGMPFADTDAIVARSIGGTVNDSLLLRKPGNCLIYWVKVLHIMKVYKIPLPRRNNQAKPNPSQNASKSGWYLIMLMPCKVPSILNKSTQLASHRNM